MRRTLLCGVLAVVWCWTGPVSGARAQSLTLEERQLVAQVDAHANDAEALLEEVVNIPSATANLEGVRRVGDVFRRELEALGFTTRWSELPVEMQRAGHMVAERIGTEGSRLLLLGHLDTLLQGERFIRKGMTAYGTGIGDMKGGNVVLLHALKALHARGWLNQRRIVVILTGDEEGPGQPLAISRQLLTETAKRSDLALSFETGTASQVAVARRGASAWTLEVTGTAGHSSQIFGSRLGDGAVFEAARILTAFHDQLREQNVTFNPGVIVGGTTAEMVGASGTASGPVNAVAQKVLVKGDLRFLSEAQKETTRMKMRTIVEKHLPQTKSVITFLDLYPGMAPTSENLNLLTQLNQITQALGGPTVTARDPDAGGAGDLSFAAPFVPAMEGLGATGQGGHAPGESVDLSMLPLQIRRSRDLDLPPDPLVSKGR